MGMGEALGMFRCTSWHFEALLLGGEVRKDGGKGVDRAQTKGWETHPSHRRQSPLDFLAGS